MIETVRTIYLRELRSFWRNRQFRLVALVLCILTGIAAVDGWNRARSQIEAREAAVASDREVWLQQGEKSPHGAAHFSNYAFRVMPSLAAFEPGILDYAGAAVWLEAHYQDPPTLRRAEDKVAFAPFPTLSPARVIRIVGSLALLVLLFPAIAGERESGVLRSLAVVGIRTRELVLGKVSATITMGVVLTCVALVVSMVPAGLLGSDLPDGSRLVALVAVHTVALAGFGLILLAVSARCRVAASALIGGASLWLASAFVVPMVATQGAASIVPDLDGGAFRARVKAEAQTAFWKGEETRKQAVADYERQLLAERGATDLASLGLNSDAVVLQAHEEFANRVFDRLYGELDGVHRGQERVLRWASAFSPLLALERVSSGFAGTDLLAQQSFTAQAEQHRRRIVEQLNLDMLNHAGEQGYAYVADRALWQQIPGFQHHPPGLGDVTAHYWFEIAALLAWLGLGAGLAVHSTARAMRPELVAC